jgi:hypothetical protein
MMAKFLGGGLRLLSQTPRHAVRKSRYEGIYLDGLARISERVGLLTGGVAPEQYQPVEMIPTALAA